MAVEVRRRFRVFAFSAFRRSFVVSNSFRRFVVGFSAEIVVWLLIIVSNPILKFRDTVSVKIDRSRPDANANLGSRMSFKGQMVAEI